MKKLFCLMLVLFICQAPNYAQADMEFAPVGAKWSYVYANNPLLQEMINDSIKLVKTTLEIQLYKDSIANILFDGELRTDKNVQFFELCLYKDLDYPDCWIDYLYTDSLKSYYISKSENYFTSEATSIIYDFTTFEGEVHHSINDCQSGFIKDNQLPMVIDNQTLEVYYAMPFNIEVFTGYQGSVIQRIGPIVYSNLFSCKYQFNWIPIPLLCYTDSEIEYKQNDTCFVYETYNINSSNKSDLFEDKIELMVSNNKLTFQIPEKLIGSQIKIYHITGSLVAEIKTSSSQENSYILHNGVYIVNVIFDNKLYYSTKICSIF